MQRALSAYAREAHGGARARRACGVFCDGEALELRLAAAGSSAENFWSAGWRSRWRAEPRGDGVLALSGGVRVRAHYYEEVGALARIRVCVCACVCLCVYVCMCVCV